MAVALLAADLILQASRLSMNPHMRAADQCGAHLGSEVHTVIWAGTDAWSLFLMTTSLE